VKGSEAWIKLALVLLFTGGIAAFFLLGGPQYLSLDTIKDNRDQLLALTERHYATAVFVAFAAYLVATALSLPGATLLGAAVCWGMGMTLMVGNPPAALALSLLERSARASIWRTRSRVTRSP
jgi:uncharacterized membrane protein YdjX (TVP38/TMEM64 family)